MHIDGEVVAKIKNNQSLELELDNREHKIRVGRKGQKSNLVKFDFSQEEFVKLKLIHGNKYLSIFQVLLFFAYALSKLFYPIEWDDLITAGAIFAMVVISLKSEQYFWIERE